MTGVPQKYGRKNNMLLYVDILEMYTGICCVLSRCVSLDEACHSTILHTQDSVQCLLALLDPDIYCEFLNRCLHCSVASSSSFSSSLLLLLLPLELHPWVGFYLLKNFNDMYKNRNRDWRACSAVPQATAIPRALDRM